MRDLRPRLLVIGHHIGAEPTGYGRVLFSLLERMGGSFEIAHFAFNFRPYRPGGARVPTPARYDLIPNLRPGDPLGREQLPQILRAVAPDKVLLCHDPDLYAVHRAALVDYRRERLARGLAAAEVTLYCPIQWEEIAERDLVPLSEVDKLVLYNEFARRVVERAWSSQGVRFAGRLAVIPHGVDGEHFYPLDREDARGSRSRARARLFPARPELRDAFIVLNANRNCPRKRVDLTLAAFAEFAREAPDSYLYLHMGMTDVGFPVEELCQALGIPSRRVLTTTSGPKHPQLSDSELNDVYNACDVGLNTATGEGFGLVALEHAATCAAQIVPAHSACAELWANAGLLVALAPESADLGAVSVPALVVHLRRLYYDESERELWSRRALALATSAHHDWDHLAETWTAELMR